MLLPTVSDQPRTDFASVNDYFESFLLKKPQGEHSFLCDMYAAHVNNFVLNSWYVVLRFAGKIIDGNINIGDGWASDAGIYEFTMGATGDKVKGKLSSTFHLFILPFYVHTSCSQSSLLPKPTHSPLHLQLRQRRRHLENPTPPLLRHARRNRHGQAHHRR